MRLAALTGLLIGLAWGTASAQPTVVLELFTSQSCSSCPPADALMAEYVHTRPDVLPLDFHVDYWNRLDWRDPYSSPEATGRQTRYAASLGSEVFTPQLVVGGRVQVVGSDRPAVEAAILKARGWLKDAPALAMARRGGRLQISVGSGSAVSATLLLVGFDGAHVTRVQAGENGGRTLSESNVVRSWRSIGRWTGAAAHLDAAPGQGERFALLLQDESGHILASAVLP